MAAGVTTGADWGTPPPRITERAQEYTPSEWNTVMAHIAVLARVDNVIWVAFAPGEGTDLGPPCTCQHWWADHQIDGACELCRTCVHFTPTLGGSPPIAT